MSRIDRKEFKKFMLLLIPILVIGFAVAAYADTEKEYEIVEDEIPSAVLTGEFKQAYESEWMETVELAQNLVTYENSSKLEKIARIMDVTSLPEEAAFALVKHSEKLEIRLSLLLALMELESDFNKFEVGSHDDRGYMQIIPGTEKWLAEDYGELIDIEYNPERIFEADYNIGLSAVYLNILKSAYGENYHRILSEYNRGPYNLKAYYQKHGTYSTSYSRRVLSLEKKFMDLNM